MRNYYCFHICSFAGSYMGFDKDQPTSSSGGKKVVAQKLKEKHQR